ncbi:putative rna binding protein [Botrytis fragariae]|uniref:Putative rna binding protein n=1 Tax=Botrytis fragariae TaxID=1964551 RepID=A0A8H6B3Q5_9HELO|nr:putative rna binding protein [Botrytis fragariae]KAF5878814.1 putative rna binding protein [Botrytis fragariae]
MGFGTGASRAERKAKRRKIENSIPDIPDDLGTEANDDGAVSTKRKRSIDDDAKVGQAITLDRKEEIADKNVESHHKSKKNKTSSTESSLLPMQIGEPSDIAETEAAPKKSKKERKAERKAKEADAKSTSIAQTAEPATGNATGPPDQISAERKRAKTKKQGGASGDNSESKAARFIVFIGNLPFTATTASIKNHFAAVKPASVRHLTEKGNPTKSRGCAFLEFEGYDHMKTCLKQFHQSTFNDGISAPRKLNVELTAGGGGNTKDRRSKIKEKNVKLNEQRVRQAQEADNPKVSKKEAVQGVKHVLAEDSGVHPSRKARIGG